MEEKIDALVGHMAKSHMELARIITAKKDVVFQMSHLIVMLPDRHPSYMEVETLVDNASGVTKSITSYLGGLAELVEAVNDNLTHVMAEMKSANEE